MSDFFGLHPISDCIFRSVYETPPLSVSVSLSLARAFLYLSVGVYVSVCVQRSTYGGLRPVVYFREYVRDCSLCLSRPPSLSLTHFVVGWGIYRSYSFFTLACLDIESLGSSANRRLCIFRIMYETVLSLSPPPLVWVLIYAYHTLFVEVNHWHQVKCRSIPLARRSPV